MDSKGVVGDEPGGLIMRKDSSDEAFCAIHRQMPKDRRATSLWLKYAPLLEPGRNMDQQVVNKTPY